jgi:hypothetical protein
MAGDYPRRWTMRKGFIAPRFNGIVSYLIGTTLSLCARAVLISTPFFNT